MRINYKQTFIDFGKGTVVLAGAGPGGKKLVTLKVYSALKEADIILYDALVGEELLEYSTKACKLIFAGKAKKKKACSQKDINEWMVYYAKKNKKVLRLKGGDPSFFSRGSQEINFLKKNNIKYQVFSGISSSQEAIKTANLKFFMHNGICNFMTGHRKISDEQKISYTNKIFCNKGRIIVYMGIGQIKKISTELIESGMPKKTSVTVVSNISFQNERIVSSDLANVAQQIKKKKIQPPSIIIIN